MGTLGVPYTLQYFTQEVAYLQLDCLFSWGAGVWRVLGFGCACLGFF